MKIRKAFKFCLKPSALQTQLLKQYAGSCRAVWNKTLAEQKKRLDEGLYCESYETFAKQLPLWKKAPEFFWLKEAPASALQQKLKDLDKALKDAFNKNQPLKKFPKFKKRGDGDSFRIPQPSQFQLKRKQIKLPKLTSVRY